MSVTIRGALAGANTSARWLTVGQDGDVKIVLEAPGTELANAFRLAGLLGQELVITFAATDGHEPG